MDNISNYSRNNIIWYLVIVLCIFLSFYYSYISAIGIFIGMAFIITHNYEDTLCLLIALFSFAPIFKIPMVSTSMFTVLEIVFIIMYMSNMRIVNGRYILTLMLFATYCLIASIVAGNISVLNILKICMNITLVYIFISVYELSSTYKYVFYYIFGLLISSFIGLFKTSIPGFLAMYSDLNTQYINGERVIRFSGTFNDPNYYSIAVIVGICIIITLYAGRICHKKMCFMSFSGVALAVFGCMTYSKSYYLMLVIAFAFILIFLALNDKIGWISLIVILGIVVLASGILSNLEIVQAMLNRFESTSGSTAEMTSGRSDVWSEYFEYISSNLRVFLFGDGIGAPYYADGAVHNLYIETWYYVGIVGLIGYIITIWIIFTEKIFIQKTKVLNFFLLAIVAVMYFFLCGFTACEFPIYMIMCWIVMNTDFSVNYYEYISQN